MLWLEDFVENGPELAEYVQTRKGQLLVHEGYSFWLKNRLQFGKKQWYCSYRPKTGCLSAINTELQRVGDVIKLVRGIHNHKPPVFVKNIDGSTYRVSNSDDEGILIYFKKTDENIFTCNICDASIVLESDSSEDLVGHIKYNHENIYELHKKNIQDGELGYEIEFLTMENVVIKRTKAKKGEKVLKVKPKMKEKRAKIDGKKRSWIWKYFEKLTSDIFRCTLCCSELSIKGFNTNNMNRHVKSKHPDIYKSEMSWKKPNECQEVASEVEIPTIKYEEITVTSESANKSGDEDGHARLKRSWIWQHFDVVSTTLAKCKICQRVICHGGTATGNMNRHMKMVHKDTYYNYVVSLPVGGQEKEDVEEAVAEDVEWIWKLFSSQDDNFYACRICSFKCLKLANHSKTVGLILKHLNKEHQVTSGDQIITGPECMSDGVDDDDERAAAVDYLTSEVLQC